MVLRDLDGGHISAVSYDCNAPVEKTLQSFAVNLSSQPDLRPGPQPGARREGRGRLAAGQRRAARHDDRHRHGRREADSRPAGKDASSNVEQLNLWCADGMRSVKLADVQRVRFLNPVMDNEVQQGAGDADAVARHAEEGGQPELRRAKASGNVRVGYVIENPIWKTSYRLVLGKEKEDKPFLQGWAVVENATDEDWKDVRMALVSRPAHLLPDGPVHAAVRAAARRSCPNCSPRSGPSPTTAT